MIINVTPSPYAGGHNFAIAVSGRFGGVTGFFILFTLAFLLFLAPAGRGSNPAEQLFTLA